MKKQAARKVKKMTRSEKAKGDCRLKVTTKTKRASDQAEARSKSTGAQERQVIRYLKTVIKKKS